MPTYEFNCELCDKNYSINLRMSESNNGKCPDCGCESDQRRIINGGAVFKGIPNGRPNQRKGVKQ